MIFVDTSFWVALGMPRDARHDEATGLGREHADDAQFVLRCVQISKQAGFRGVYSIEYGGPNPYGGVQHIIDLLLQSL